MIPSGGIIARVGESLSWTSRVTDSDDMKELRKEIAKLREEIEKLKSD
jgi:hypothetical protein